MKNTMGFKVNLMTAGLIAKYVLCFVASFLQLKKNVFFGILLCVEKTIRLYCLKQKSFNLRFRYQPKVIK